VIRPKQWDDRWTRYAASRIAQKRALDAGETVWRPEFDELFEEAYRKLKQHLRQEREKKARGLGTF
jgi:hypothetical protein